MEAAFLTRRISRLILYEPPLQDRIDLDIADKMKELIRAQKREGALIIFLRDAVKISAAEISAMRSRPSWSGLIATIDSQPRHPSAIFCREKVYVRQGSITGFSPVKTIEVAPYCLATWRVVLFGLAEK